MMSLLYYNLLWKMESKPTTTPGKTGDQDPNVIKNTDEKEPQGKEPSKSPKFLDITQDQAFWDKAVPS
ncbi:hypothetical protein [Sporomusa sp.]|uniref:hypothetical protein n=1 Tax=Sporomusa sp. TaxID=2078658 RepID=UPI002B6096B1|nr:hypothetical protein [Sporomusa sp.]HWR42600.1 hypothetical protein [Sporomusa sp.]